MAWWSVLLTGVMGAELQKKKHGYNMGWTCSEGQMPPK